MTNTSTSVFYAFDSDSHRPIAVANLHGQQIDTPVAIAPGGLNELSHLMVVVSEFAKEARAARGRNHAAGMPQTFGQIYGMSGPTQTPHDYTRPHVPLIVPGSKSQRGQEFARAKSLCRKKGQVVFALTALRRSELPAHHPLQGRGQDDDMVYRFRVLVPFLRKFKEKNGKVYASWSVRTIEAYDQISAKKAASDQEKRLFATLVSGAAKKFTALEGKMPGLKVSKRPPARKTKKTNPPAKPPIKQPQMDAQLTFLSAAV